MHLKFRPSCRACIAPLLVTATFLLPGTALGACQELRDRIAATIESNGVPPLGYSLEVIPTEDADQAEGEIVGHCRNNAYQIVYQRQPYEPGESPEQTEGVESLSPDVSPTDESNAAERVTTESRSLETQTVETQVDDDGRVRTVHEPESN